MRFLPCVVSLFILSAAVFGTEEPDSHGSRLSRHLERATSATEEEKSVLPFFESARTMVEENHIVAFYGHPKSRTMGILGEFRTMDAMAEELLRYADAYNEVNGDKGVVPAVHIIFATAHPGGETTLIGKKTLLEYIEYAEEKGMLVFIDHQIGKYPLAEAMKSMLPYLKHKNVHLAIDPEWATPAPGAEIGSVCAGEINQAQEMMQDYMETHDIPGEKMLVVHQFNWKMIADRAKVQADYPRILLIHNADGFGTPREKFDSYRFNSGARNMPLKGFKLFLPKTWRQGGYDIPLMSPEKVLELDPVPILVMYQ